jgi:PKD repeat protein
MGANYNTGTPGQIFFQNQSFSFGGITGYQWDFGDNTISNQMDPNHTYTASGYYNVCLTITGSTGCTSTWCNSVYVDLAWWGGNPFQGNCTAGFLIFPGPANGGMINIVNTSQGNFVYYTWDFGNGIISNSANPFITYNASGTYPICLTILDSMSGCTDTFCDTITIDSLGMVTRSLLNGNIGVRVSSTAQPNNLLSIQAENKTAEIMIAPNPSNGLITLSNLKMEGVIWAEVIDLSGKVVFNQQLNSSKGINSCHIDLSHLANGTYFLRTTDNVGVNTTRLVIQK